MLAASDLQISPTCQTVPFLIIAADARLDNRREIEARLGLDAHPRLSDAALIGALYDRYGSDCPSHLLGDFAFLIWDEKHQILFGARDHFGVRPFYYHTSPALFIAATTSETLLRSGVSPEKDETGMADFVAGAFADQHVTLHRHIQRLPPGHSIRASHGGTTIQQYWKLVPREPSTERDLGEEFRHIFEQAIACRMTDPSVGAMLSGGLDSSSIAMVASRLSEAADQPPLPSLSMTFDATPGWNEGPFIRTILQAGHFSPHFLPSDHHDPLRDIDTMLAEQEGPFLAYNHGVSRRIYHFASGAGINLLLDGHGGDEVVSHGFGRLNELAMEKRWTRLWHEAGGVAQIFGISTWQVASPYFDHIRAIRSVRRRWRRVASRAPDTNEATAFNAALVAPDLARRTQIAERQALIACSRSAYQTEQQRHLEILSSPHQAYAFEVFDRASAAAGVGLRFPFYDRRLVEFCLSAPDRKSVV